MTPSRRAASAVVANRDRRSGLSAPGTRPRIDRRCRVRRDADRRRPPVVTLRPRLQPTKVPNRFLEFSPKAWIAVRELRRQVGQTSITDEIRRAVRPRNRTSPPCRTRGASEGRRSSRRRRPPQRPPAVERQERVRGGRFDLSAQAQFVTRKTGLRPSSTKADGAVSSRSRSSFSVSRRDSAAVDLLDRRDAPVREDDLAVGRKAFPDRRPRRDDDQFRPLQPRRDLVEVGEAGREAAEGQFGPLIRLSMRS